MAASFNVDKVREAWSAQERDQRDMASAARKQYFAQINDPTQPDPESDSVPDEYPWRFIKELWTDFVIVCAEDSKYGEDLTKVPYTVSDDGDITFGDEQPIKVQYVPLSDSDDSTLVWVNPNGRAVNKLVRQAETATPSIRALLSEINHG